MKRSLLGIFVVLGLLSTVASLLAHHSFAAEFDQAKPITMTGTVTKVDWMNPHVYFYLDVKDETGKVTNWAAELGPPAMLYRQGWKKEALKIGGSVTIAGSLAKDGSPRVNASTVTLDGKRLFAGSSGDGGNNGR
jgi:hypothetical protein